ncbi:CRE-SPO-11 protein [Aphelenchoides avenae]|nr:CRE-SPO-11 protein [Aphelenchus avenae]
MDPPDIMRRIERAIFDFALNLTSIAQSSTAVVMKAPLGPDAPKTLSGEIKCTSRTSVSFAMQVRVLSQVYSLLRTGRRATKRDLYYEYKRLYGCQQNFDRALSAICHFLNVERLSLNVLSCSRGFAIGNLVIWGNENEVMDFRHAALSINDAFMKFTQVSTSAKFVLVVEKECAFQKLVDEKFTQRFPDAILVTGRGYPDFNTRRFLRWLYERRPLPMFALVDADPYGIEILATYRYGSARSKVESGDLSLPRIQWLGVLPSDVPRLPISPAHYLKLSARDYTKIVRLMKRAAKHNDAQMISELNVLQQLGHKLEIEAVSTIQMNYLSNDYLAKKLYG